MRRLLSRRLGGRTARPITHLFALKAVAVEGVRSQAALAERLTVDAPQVSRIVDRLVEDGLVRRCAGDDRRCVRLEVTEAAQPELELLRAETLWVEEEASRHLTEAEVRELKRLLDKLQTGLLPGDETGP
ncbi:MarR family transcriptional regulator [Myxococcaceae bacterium GXIMD 01537]